ncbi:hypothetical protein [Mucilaginibacter aquariorum]|uniref:Uncharacterized protein n=1 Tax=Mucilaginibacter aquariorum TaxID=2967225 RepID=A0ABT1T470_9SPHI|nr:hypothetical protein [Mucilaginibacter aquariorum]MCQ6959263.1 hypothetical protein [Mucilaginibacter aquariorum]
MKNVTAILLLTAYLFSTTELHQLLKIPMFFEHFAQHRIENKSISLLQFLDMHYMHGSPKDKDYDDDMKLPFKKTDNCAATVSPVDFPPCLQTLTIPLISLVEVKTAIPQEQFIPTFHLTGIWQPPKSC